MRIYDSLHDLILGSQISDNIWKDNNGQLICENVVLSRTGSYDYREDELFKDGSPDKIVKVYRKPEDVFDPISIKSMNYKPLCDDHPDDNVTPETVSALQKGFMTNVRRGTGEFSECLMADLVVTDPYVIDEIMSKKKRDLSVGYTADIVEEDGRYVMKNIRGNHIALCEAGRAGNARIRDSRAVMDFEAKGSFDSIEELVKHYKGATTEAKDDKVVVRLSSGKKLLYSYVSGSNGKLVFVRKMNDSDGGKSMVEVIGDSVKLREGQRVEYFGTPCKITSIAPNLGLKTFMVEFGAEGVLCGRHSYDEVSNFVNQGKIRLLDSVMFDSNTGEFVLKAEDTDTEITKYNGQHTDPAHEKELDRTHYMDALNFNERMVYAKSFLSAKDESELERKAGELLNYDKKLYSKVMENFRLLHGFEAKKNAMASVLITAHDSAFSDADDVFVLYSPSRDLYISMQTELAREKVVQGAKAWAQKWRSRSLAEGYLGGINDYFKQIGRRADWKVVPLADSIADSVNPTVKAVEQDLKNLGLKFVREGRGWTGSVGQVYKSTQKFEYDKDFNKFMQRVDSVLDKYQDVTFNGGLLLDGTLSLTVSFHGIKDSAFADATRKSLIEKLRTVSVPYGERYQVTDGSGWSFDLQHHGKATYENIEKYPRVSPKESSDATLRFWYNGAFVKKFEGPINKVKADGISFLSKQLKDSAENLKSFKVKVGDRTFVTKANNSAEAVVKVKDSLKVCDEDVYFVKTSKGWARVVENGSLRVQFTNDIRKASTLSKSFAEELAKKLGGEVRKGTAI